MKVIRTMPPDGWVPVANTTAQNHQLSWRARGLLVELLSYPDGYDLTFDRLMARAKLAGGACEGRDAMRKAMQELERAGLIAHVRKRVKGEVGDRIAWATVTVVCDSPEALLRATGFQEAGRSGGQSSSMTESQELSNKTGSLNTDHQDSAGQHSSSLAFAREGQQASKQDRRATLERTWSLVDRLDEPQLRNALLDFERKRPAIYRECRQAAISQFEHGEVHVLKGESRGLATDRLSYKYAIQHYAEKLPPWIVKHLREAA
ncbi:hypothetical protein ABZX95_17340 [Streptomyces sp. NPDC004232]|uniref:hypothetical protein n=1 Tax=Streptomyces sp. NPDC004232 TaxID=3154454 RepID=UPI0033BE7D16